MRIEGKGAGGAARGPLVPVVLVDLDGTVLHGPAGRRAMLDAVEATAGSRPTDFDRPTFTGRTDAWIARELLRRVGHAADDEAVRRLHAHYLDRLSHHLGSGGCDALPGALALGVALAEAAQSGRSGPHLLLTGNLKEAAVRKLRAASLLDAFPAVGAFGDEREDRRDLAADAAAMAPGRRYVVLGDAPADIVAARAIGARVVIVATGPISAAELALHRPDALLPSLSDTAAVLDALFG